VKNDAGVGRVSRIFRWIGWGPVSWVRRCEIRKDKDKHNKIGDRGCSKRRVNVKELLPCY